MKHIALAAALMTAAPAFAGSMDTATMDPVVIKADAQQSSSSAGVLVALITLTVAIAALD
jgi:hypothetical protein